MSAHSFLPPSGASAWSRCALWPTMNARYPQDESPETIEGNAAHWVAWELLANRPIKEGMSDPAGTIVTQEMIEGGEMVRDTVLVKAGVWGLDLHIEERIKILHIHHDCFGTPDVWAYNLAANHLHIFDYKFGHRFVDEHFNKQGLCYLNGILDVLPISTLDVDVSFTIIQPRCYQTGEPIRSHTFNASEAFVMFEDLQDAAETATDPQPPATTGDYCRDCPGRHACPALQEAAYSDAEFSNNRIPHDLSPSAAALELRMLERAKDRLEARVEGLKELTLSNLKAGKDVRYYRADQGNARSQWTRPPEQIITIGQLLGKDLSKPTVVTPLQAKKLGIDEAVISAYSHTPKGSIKLVPENPADALRVFALKEEK